MAPRPGTGRVSPSLEPSKVAAPEKEKKIRVGSWQQGAQPWGVVPPGEASEVAPGRGQPRPGTQQCGLGKNFLRQGLRRVRKGVTHPGARTPALVEHVGVGKGVRRARTSRGNSRAGRVSRCPEAAALQGDGGQSRAPWGCLTSAGCLSPSCPEHLAVP